MSLRRFRRANKLYAFIAGYYWLPCVNCGTWYGGHEGGGTLWLSSGSDLSRQGQVLCWNCPEDEYAEGYVGYRDVADDTRPESWISRPKGAHQ